MARKRKSKNVFRFMALPPELQIQIAERLNLGTLENLSLCSKATRASIVGDLDHAADAMLTLRFSSVAEGAVQGDRDSAMRVWGGLPAILRIDLGSTELQHRIASM